MVLKGAGQELVPPPFNLLRRLMLLLYIGPSFVFSTVLAASSQGKLSDGSGQRGPGGGGAPSAINSALHWMSAPPPERSARQLTKYVTAKDRGA